MTTPLVSVVIDNYNLGRFLPDAIDSALGQTWPAVEVVVVDDGSTDDSAEVIARYGDRVRAVFKENGGQTSAFNAGFAACTGDVVIFLDADDVLQPHCVERAVGELAAHPGASVVQSRMRSVDAELVPLGPTVPPEYVTLASGLVADDVRAWRTGSSFSPTGGAAFPRRTLDMLFPLTDGDMGPDYYLLRGAALLGPVVAVDETAVDYRSHGANDSHLAELDAAGIRRALHRQLVYSRMLDALAERLGQPPLLDPLVAPDALFLTQRIASLRLDPDGHPCPGDTRAGLAWAGVRAALGRRDLRPAKKATQAVWFVLMAVSPRPLARWLATQLMLPLSRVATVGDRRPSPASRALALALRR